MKIKKDRLILWEAHRGGGGGYEMPESCKLSFEYGWLHGGYPEADVNVTSDNVLVSLHDSTLDRIARNLQPQFKGKHISQISWNELQTIDIGWDDYPDQRVVSMEMLFRQLQANKERHMVIDYKNVDLHRLADMISQFDVTSQITFAYCDRNVLREMKSLLPDITTKHWLGGTPSQIIEKFSTDLGEEFEGISEVQIHLNGCDKNAAPGTWRYPLPKAFLKDSLELTQDWGRLLQAAPWQFEREDIWQILDIGIRSFAVDFPHKFTQSCAVYFGNNWN